MAELKYVSCILVEKWLEEKPYTKIRMEDYINGIHCMVNGKFIIKEEGIF